jgi:hypothetical protein
MQGHVNHVIEEEAIWKAKGSSSRQEAPMFPFATPR